MTSEKISQLRRPARRARYRLAGSFVRDADAMPVHHFPALPAGEQEACDRDLGARLRS